jgi:arylsulfatase A-like enzyme
MHAARPRRRLDSLACVQGVDNGVGRVLDWLDAEGLADEMIVINTTDNGWYLGDFGLYDKRFMDEPGLRVPLLARGPGIKAGGTPEQFVATIDFAPTILDLAGMPVPESMQGRSISYRYDHDPGNHNIRAHSGVRTATHGTPSSRRAEGVGVGRECGIGDTGTHRDRPPSPDGGPHFADDRSRGGGPESEAIGPRDGLLDLRRRIQPEG